MTPLERLLARVPELDDEELVELAEELARVERAMAIRAGSTVWVAIDSHLSPWAIVEVLDEDDGPHAEVLLGPAAATFVIRFDDLELARYPRHAEELLLLSIGAARSYLLAPYWADDFSEN